MEWNGGCLCGEIRYRANVDPEWVAYCHCTMCRKQSGAPLTVSVLFPREAVEWTHKIAERRNEHGGAIVEECSCSRYRG